MYVASDVGTRGVAIFGSNESTRPNRMLKKVIFGSVPITLGWFGSEPEPNRPYAQPF